jgi:hydroxypyruvate isomerase
MSRQDLLNRRALLHAAGAGAVGALAADQVSGAAAEPTGTKGRIKQSVCRWCYGSIPLDKLAAAARKMGFQSIELLSKPEEVKTVKSAGLTCAMLGGVSITKGLNRTEHHDKLVKQLQGNIELAAAEGLPNVICMSGNREGMPDDEGLKNCAAGLKRVVGLAEEKKVTVCMELLNSKVNHPDYMCDHTTWGAELVRRVGSPRFKLLYDIYHMQIMEGDVIATIRKHHDAIAHYHTGGVPGRHEIDETQELNYPAIVRAILATGYQGYLGQEFIPSKGRDPLDSLAQGFRICDV